jgi:hypothetical protein
VRALAVDAFRALPAYQEHQRAFRDRPGAAGAAKWDGGVAPTVSVMQPVGTRAVSVWVTAKTKSGCADYEGQLAALFEIVEGRATLLFATTEPVDTALRGAVDSDGDGRLELLFEGTRVRFGAGRYGIEALNVPFLDCTC